MSGPYSLHCASDGTFQVRQRYGKVIRTYPIGQEAAAEADVRRLQAGFTKAEKQLRDAAPDLLEALEAIVAEQCDYATINNLGDPEKQHNIIRARAALAKARGEQS